MLSLLLIYLSCATIPYLTALLAPQNVREKLAGKVGKGEETEWKPQKRGTIVRVPPVCPAVRHKRAEVFQVGVHTSSPAQVISLS